MDDIPILDQLIDQLRRVLVPYYGASDPSAYAAQYATRFTTFDPWSQGRKDDEAAREYGLSAAGTIPRLDFEIANARVDLVGDAAIFTFHVDISDPASGERIMRWNATHVHDMGSEGLQLVHTHWSHAVPPQQDATGA